MILDQFQGNVVSEEKRRDVRVPCRLEVETENKWFVLYSKTISASGMLLSCESDVNKLISLGITPEKEILLSFCPPDQGYIVKVSSRIIYVERKESTVYGMTSHIGVQFIQLPDNAKKDIEAFVVRQKMKNGSQLS